MFDGPGDYLLTGLKNVRVYSQMCGGGGVRDFLQSIPPEDFKWNSPNSFNFFLGVSL